MCSALGWRADVDFGLEGVTLLLNEDVEERHGIADTVVDGESHGGGQVQYLVRQCDSAVVSHHKKKHFITANFLTIALPRTALKILRYSLTVL